MPADLAGSSRLVKVCIVHPSGSHGNFLKLILNELVGIKAKPFDDMIYDHVEYESPPVFDIAEPLTHSKCINIRVSRSSYLKYFAMCLNRTSGHNITAETLGENCFERLMGHSIMSHFLPSLSQISGQTQGDVEVKFVREWLRLCFFADQGRTITSFLAPKIYEPSDFIVDFESFYNQSLLSQCVSICHALGLKTTDTESLQRYLDSFVDNNVYYGIDQCIPDIVKAIDNNQMVDLSHTNVIQQAWIDNYLVEQYNIDPVCRNEYFNNTAELVEEYKLLKGES